VGTGLAIDLELSEDLPELDEALRITAYRVIGEALTNVVKHAAARHCTVRVRVEGDELVVEVSDDGRGLRAAAAAEDGFGLRSMRERAAALGGTLAVERTAASSGTAVRARLPLTSKVSTR